MTGRAGPRRARASIRGLVLACHPVPTLAVTTVVVVLAAGVGLAAVRVVVIGAAVLTGQLSIGWSNDAIDAARDRDAGRSDKPVATGGAPRAIVAWAAALALLATVALSALLGVRAAAAALTLVTAGWAYNLGLKSTPLSAATYLVGFGALPLVPYLAQPVPVWPPWWVPVTGALLGLGAHFANVLPDLRADAASGVRGLPHRLGPRWGVVVMAITLAAAAVVLGLGPSAASTAFAVTAVAGGVVGAAAVAALALRVPDSAAAFRLTLALAVLDVSLLIAVAT